MATNVKTNSMDFPYSLGKLMPGASFATVSIPLTANIVPVHNDGTKPDNQFNAIWIQASPDNLLPIFVCKSAAAPDTVNYTNVLAWLSKGEVYSRTKEWANNRDVSKLYIGAGNATDFAIASLDQF